MLIPSPFRVGEGAVQAAIIQVAVEIAKCRYKPEFINEEKVAMIARELQIKIGNVSQEVNDEGT